jgi:hypothetical protein
LHTVTGLIAGRSPKKYQLAMVPYCFVGRYDSTLHRGVSRFLEMVVVPSLRHALTL